MFKYRYSKIYDLNKLIQEISDVGIPMMSMDLINSHEFIVNTAEELNGSQVSALNSVVSSHVSTTNMEDIVAGKISAARAFGNKLIAQYGAQNVLAGYDIATIQMIMEKTAKVLVALNTGSLYVAITELNAIETDESIVTAAKVKAFRNLIEDYLQTPRT